MSTLRPHTKYLPYNTKSGEILVKSYVMKNIILTEEFRIYQNINRGGEGGQAWKKWRQAGRGKGREKGGKGGRKGGRKGGEKETGREDGRRRKGGREVLSLQTWHINVTIDYTVYSMLYLRQ